MDEIPGSPSGHGWIVEARTIRDTHFLGFAKILYDDIYRRIEQDYGPMHHFTPKVRQAVEQIIAQHAYDLLYFLLDNAPYQSASFDTGYGTPDEIRAVIKALPAPQADAPEPAADQPPATSPRTD